VTVTVHVKPNARKTGIVAWLDDTTVKVEVTAPPEKGRANEAVQCVLAEHYGIAKSRVTLVRGTSTRMKQFQVEV
jgi:uncharacterized protein (TIGR00251 family)